MLFNFSGLLVDIIKLACRWALIVAAFGSLAVLVYAVGWLLCRAGMWLAGG